MRGAAVLLSLVLGALVGAGCSGGGGSGAPGAAANVLRVNLGTEVQDLDPHTVTGVPEHRALAALFEGLADLDPATMAPIPAAATHWEISEDGLRYVFHLREDGKWSNGDPVTAGDFVYSYQRMLSPAMAAEYAYFLHALKNGKAYNEGRITDFAEVGARALDDRTLEITLEHPTPYFLGMQTHQAWFPVHRGTVEAHGGATTRGSRWTRAGNHVGNGPWLLAEWRPGEYIQVLRNPHYWNAGAIRLDGIRFFPIDNQQTEERSFRAGDLHMTDSIPLHRIETYRKDNPEVLQIGPYLGTYFYRVNLTRAPFTDLRVRQALALAVDRETLAETVCKAGEQPAFHFTPPGISGYTPEAGHRYDVARAQALLAEAGYPGGQGLPPVEILYNTSEQHQTIAEAIQAMWKRNLGIDVRLLNQDWKVYLTSQDTLDYGLARAGWIADYVDPINFLECFLTHSGNNRTGFSDAEYDRLIAAAYAETDGAARNALLQQAETILLDAVAVIPLYFYTYKFLLGPEVRGYTPNVLDYRRWEDMWLEPAKAA
jgi:oligopeptide transport system substrate-binding protein